MTQSLEMVNCEQCSLFYLLVVGKNLVYFFCSEYYAFCSENSKLNIKINWLISGKWFNFSQQ